jgi:cell division septum initiation protein DivIVA
MFGRSAAVDDREFLVVRRGYDKDQVKAYLGEVEVSFRQLERWAEYAKARLRLAEEKGRRLYDVDEAMIAVFAAKDRVLERSRLRAERIEAEAREQAGADYEEAAAAVIEEAKEEARRLIEGALTSVRVQYESILSEARAEAYRMIEEARAEAERLVARSQAIVTGSEDAVGDSLIVDLTHDGGADEAEGDGALRRSRYERNSAMLPSMGVKTPPMCLDLSRASERPQGWTERPSAVAGNVRGVGSAFFRSGSRILLVGVFVDGR